MTRSADVSVTVTPHRQTYTSAGSHHGRADGPASAGRACAVGSPHLGITDATLATGEQLWETTPTVPAECAHTTTGELVVSALFRWRKGKRKPRTLRQATSYDLAHHVESALTRRGVEAYAEPLSYY